MDTGLPGTGFMLDFGRGNSKFTLTLCTLGKHVLSWPIIPLHKGLRCRKSKLKA